LARFDDIKYTSIHFRGNDFIEVSLTQVVDESTRDEFISVKKGYVDKGRNYKGSIPVPLDEEVVKQVAAALLKTAGVDEFDYQEEVDELEFLDG
jgi:hypothetical protein